MTGSELTKRLSPYIGKDCFRLTKEERTRLARDLEDKQISPETFGSWIRSRYAPGTIMRTKGNPYDILNPFHPKVWEMFDEWIDNEKERTYHKEASRTQAVMSLILAFGEDLGVKDALAQGSDALIVYRVLEAAGSPLAASYKEAADKILTEKPWRRI